MAQEIPELMAIIGNTAVARAMNSRIVRNWEGDSWNLWIQEGKLQPVSMVVLKGFNMCLKIRC